MSENTPSATDLSMDGEPFANDEHWRSTKAMNQLRDRFGRWISQGANVSFRVNGVDQSGVVTSVFDGKAYVDTKNLDGTTTKQIVDPSAIRVIASKATLPPDGSKINDPGNNFANALKTPAFQKALDTTGQATIQRADGYALSAILKDPEHKTGGNPVMFQLYAPGGRSLGKYDASGADSFDAMVSADQTGGPAASAPAGPAGGAVAASIAVVGGERPFRVPETVKNEIQSTIASLSAELPEADFAVASRLANDSTVSLSDVQWIHGFFCDNEISENIRGGYKGRKWASKIVDPSGDDIILEDDAEDTLPKYSFDDDEFGYFAVGQDAGSTMVRQLLAVDYETGEVYQWTSDGFSIIPEMDMTDVDEPQIIPIDEMTADELAHWLDSGSAEEFDVLDTDPEERNLFTLADSELDYDELASAYAILAAAGDGQYTPQERSQNAKAQGRASGGRFGAGGGPKAAAAPAKAPAASAPVANGGAPAAPAPTDPSTPADGAPEPTVQKARLPVALPVVANVAARINEWLSTAAEAPVVAAGAPTDLPEYTEEDQATEDAATGPTDEALYFAIVDSVDKTAVLDAVAIVKQNGQPSAFIRKDGAWTASPDTLTLLQGSTPPTVVELPDPETVKGVLSQIDSHDSGSDQTNVSDAEAPQPGEQAVAASGYAMADGSYTILSVDDLQAVVASSATPDLFVKAHIRKRARALNRMDIVPYDWREFTLAEIGELSASKGLYGEFGEILVASGIPGTADTPSDLKNAAKLQAYWTTGKGALKVRWGTPGDLTRAHRHLSKYVGPEMAWGLAQNYHKSLFGVSNKTHDIATGQYVPRTRKK